MQTGESSLTPASMQISPRDLTRSQGGLARSSLENADPVIARRRVVGKRTTISPAPLVLSDNVDSASVPESLNEAGLPEVLEPSEGDTKKRRVEESFDESVDWCQKERSAIAWMTNVSNEKYLKSTLVIHWNLKGVSVEKETVRWEIKRGYLSPSPARSTIIR